MKKMSQVLFLMSFFSMSTYAQDKSPWIYFDLGDTVINTKDMKNLSYMKGAREYIHSLKREGFKIGIITNIPETWGMDYEEKFQTLKKMIDDGWSEASPFDWSAFDEVILPMKNEELKPSPTLFLKAIQIAESCPSAFIGESPKEIDAARKQGMAADLYDESKAGVYIPVKDIKSFLVTNYHREYDNECLQNY